MIKFEHPEAIQSHLRELAQAGKKIGFVPTMGALHYGHMALVRRAKKENDLVVCSIFVNPLQFNRREDLTNYPNRLKEDSEMLKEVGCDILFTPSKKELYTNQPSIDFDFGSIAQGMEAEYRPGHFEGVAAVIERFLSILSPHKAYFGEKDFQQLAIVRWVKEHFKFDTKIIGCETVRDENGLAMSSRNYLLEEKHYITASEIYQLMKYCQTQVGKQDPQELAKNCFETLKKNFKPEYFEIVDEKSLKPIKKWSESKRPRVFVAAYLGAVRLIDNLSLAD
ncbi:MAG: pantoate--beta-alanine ligase [Vicingaceae bacterium]